MALNEATTKNIIDFVKPEPRTVQEIAKKIKKSWLTADSYVKQIKDKTGLINIKTFRKGTQGALKLVYYSHPESLIGDEVKENLFVQIKRGYKKEDFDFMEVFQFVPEKKKRFSVEEYDKEDHSRALYQSQLLRQATDSIYIFSGNLSFLKENDKKQSALMLIEELLKRKVVIRILCRVNIASVANIKLLSRLMIKYPRLIEARHCYHPLRGFIIDSKIARFKNEEKAENYRKGELERNMKIYYEVYDEDWILWLQKVFWSMFRGSIDLESRMKEVRKIY
ncbi:MAG: hypothetical protein ABIB71_01745 [Candidatus Woesearchaeota archaeon]